MFAFAPSSLPDVQRHLPPSLAGRRPRGPALLMYVDYRRSDCGPYREILYIPGSLPFGSRRFATIASIYVSTIDSVVNGRANWGIPKDRADFDVERRVDGTKDERIHIRFGGREIANLRIRAGRFGLPATSRLIPGPRRTLAHHWEGKTYLTTPLVNARVTPARLIESSFDPELFPDVSGSKVLSGFTLKSFRMTFPKARIEEGLL